MKTIILSEDLYYNFEMISEIITELGCGEIRVQELVNVVDRLYSDLSEVERFQICVKTIKIIKILN